MKSIYKPLGNYIHLVDERNKENETEDVKGINIDKYFMPSVANIIGTDLSKYKLLRKNRFACNPMHVGRDGRLPVAVYTESIPAIVSPAYFMFEINDKRELFPEYLMLCFRRPDFDRICALKTDSSVRGGITWEDLCSMEIPVPDISMQKRIVYDYKVITDRIELLNKINRNLSEQSQMVVCSYMDNKSYKMKPLSEIAEVIDCLHSKKPSAIEDGTKQLIQLDNITDSGFLDLDNLKYMISDDDYTFWTRKCEIIAGDCVITNVGRVGAVSQAPIGTHAAMGRNMTCIRLKNQYKWQAYLITMLLSGHMKNEISKNTDVGTIMNALNVKDIPKLEFPIFCDKEMINLENDLKAIRGMIESNYLENQRLKQLRDTLLPKLMSGELDVSDLDI